MYLKTRLSLAAAAALAVAASISVLAPIAVAVLDVAAAAVLFVSWVFKHVAADLQALCSPKRGWLGFVMLVRLHAFVMGMLRRRARSKRRHQMRPAV